ncbi:hypothetical protein VE02_03438 [Pseudogymnoascus sp. 03VT05]|nr:hypothetical protein VE02_03438 [Pseudogymnoascus sp. 03VT05]
MSDDFKRSTQDFERSLNDFVTWAIEDSNERNDTTGLKMLHDCLCAEVKKFKAHIDTILEDDK